MIDPMDSFYYFEFAEYQQREEAVSENRFKYTHCGGDTMHRLVILISTGLREWWCKSSKYEKQA